MDRQCLNTCQIMELFAMAAEVRLDCWLLAASVHHQDTNWVWLSTGSQFVQVMSVDGFSLQLSAIAMIDVGPRFPCGNQIAKLLRPSPRHRTVIPFDCRQIVCYLIFEAGCNSSSSSFNRKA
jgi:hypothetical protein